ncbi:MAG: hypothetical protein ACN6N0_13065 [Microvirgula sp.]
MPFAFCRNGYWRTVIRQSVLFMMDHMNEKCIPQCNTDEIGKNAAMQQMQAIQGAHLFIAMNCRPAWQNARNRKPGRMNAE